MKVGIVKRLSLRDRAEEYCSWTKHTPDFTKKQCWLVEMLEYRVRENGIECVVLERNAMTVGQRVSLDGVVVDTDILQLQVFRRQALVARTASQIEEATARRKPGLGGRKQLSRVANRC